MERNGTERDGKERERGGTEDGVPRRRGKNDRDAQWEDARWRRKGFELGRRGMRGRGREGWKQMLIGPLL